MNTTKTIILIATALIALAIMLLIIQFLLRKLKAKGFEDGKIKASFSVWFSAMFLSATAL
jgi:hypothetical protein